MNEIEWGRRWIKLSTLTGSQRLSLGLGLGFDLDLDLRLVGVGLVSLVSLVSAS